MSQTARRPATDPMEPALERLYADPRKFGFFQAVRLIYSAHQFDGRGSGARPGPLRFGAPHHLAFPGSELSTLKQDEQLLKLEVNFIGLTGPSGVLPHHYSEWLGNRATQRDHAAADFFDIFNHRVTSLFWLAWAKHRPEIGRQFNFQNAPYRYLESVIGMGTPALSARMRPDTDKRQDKRPLPSAAMLYFAGLISQKPHGERAIAQVVSALVKAPVTSQSCFGTWQEAPPSELTRLGQKGHHLGNGCLVGSRYWDRQSTLRLTLGPLDSTTYHALLPRGKQLSDLVELIRLLTGLELDLRIRLALKAEHIPPLEIGSQSENRPQLGWNTWLAGRHNPAPAKDCEFHFSALGDQSWHSTSEH